MTPKGNIYLIPVPIAGMESVLQEIPLRNAEVIRSLDYFMVENLRTARRFLSKAQIGKPIDSLQLAELNEHTELVDLSGLLEPVKNGSDAGILSEAGMPCVADPGSELVAMAHREGIKVIPLSGPSSILMALSASGMNGQCFAFNGYLPVKSDQRQQRIRELEKMAISRNQTQIFIETPYRNEQMLKDILSVCREQTRLSVSCDLSSENEWICTATIREWKKLKHPELKKRPAIFLLGC